MKLKGELDHSEVEAIIRAEIVRLFPAWRLDDFYMGYVSRCHFTLDDEPEPVAEPVSEKVEAA